MNRDLRFYLQRFMHRFPWFLIVSVTITAVSRILAATLPSVYKAEARLLMESPQIPDDLATSTVKTGAPEALEIISQRLLTRAVLLDMAQRLKIYDDAADMAPDKIVDDMRSRLIIDLPVNNSGADFVTVSFAAPTGEMSARVTNEFVTMILQENVALRTASATQTLDFFKQEVDQLGAQLGQLGGKIMQYKLEHKDALPDSLDFRRGRQASQQERLVTLQREVAGLKERRAKLVEMFNATGQVDSTAIPRSPEETQLRDLKDQLAAALALLSPQHPTVVNLKQRIAALEASMNAAAAAADPAGNGTAIGTPATTGNATFDLQIADIDSQIAIDEDEQRRIETDLANLKASIDATPGNAIELDTLQRDYDNVQLQYNNAVLRLGAAQTGDRIEALSKGQRISVIEQAVVPDRPASPNRKRIALLGGIAGIAAGLGLVVLLELLNRAVHRPSDLVARLGIQSFATIPYIETHRENLRRRSLLMAIFVILVLGVPAALYAVDVYYMPLDLLISQILDRIRP